MAGTALYMAPEALLGTGSLREAFALDLWALGCVVYEMLVGQSPFFSKNERLSLQFILTASYDFPDFLEHEGTKDFMKQLLQACPRDRLGFKARGVQSPLDDVKSHPFFGSFGLAAFEALRKQRPPSRYEKRPSDMTDDEVCCTLEYEMSDEDEE